VQGSVVTRFCVDRAWRELGLAWVFCDELAHFWHTDFVSEPAIPFNLKAADYLLGE